MSRSSSLSVWPSNSASEVSQSVVLLCPTSQDSATVSTAVKLVRMRICTDRM